MYRKNSNSQNTFALWKGNEDDLYIVSFKLIDFNQEKFILALANMIIIYEFPFKFVENEGLRSLLSRYNLG